VVDGQACAAGFGLMKGERCYRMARVFFFPRTMQVAWPPAAVIPGA